MLSKFRIVLLCILGHTAVSEDEMMGPKQAAVLKQSGLIVGGNGSIELCQERHLDEQSAGSFGGAVSENMLLVCGALVMLAQAAYSMVGSPTCRDKSLHKVCMTKLIDVCIGTICLWSFRWTIAYAVESCPDPSQSILKIQQDIFFQVAFLLAVITVASGCMLQQLQFPDNLIHTVMRTIVICTSILAAVMTFRAVSSFDWETITLAGLGKGFSSLPVYKLLHEFASDAQAVSTLVGEHMYCSGPVLSIVLFLLLTGKELFEHRKLTGSPGPDTPTRNATKTLEALAFRKRRSPYTKAAAPMRMQKPMP